MDHTIVHFEIPAYNVEKLKKFYAKLFGWKIDKIARALKDWPFEHIIQHELHIACKSSCGRCTV